MAIYALQKIKIFETEIDDTMKVPEVFKILEKLEDVGISKEYDKRGGLSKILVIRGKPSGSEYLGAYDLVTIHVPFGEIREVEYDDHKELYSAWKLGR